MTKFLYNYVLSNKILLNYIIGRPINRNRWIDTITYDSIYLLSIKENCQYIYHIIKLKILKIVKTKSLNGDDRVALTSCVGINDLFTRSRKVTKCLATCFFKKNKRKKKEKKREKRATCDLMWRMHVPFKAYTAHDFSGPLSHLKAQLDRMLSFGLLIHTMFSPWASCLGLGFFSVLSMSSARKSPPPNQAH